MESLKLVANASGKRIILLVCGAEDLVSASAMRLMLRLFHLGNALSGLTKITAIRQNAEDTKPVKAAKAILVVVGVMTERKLDPAPAWMEPSVSC